MELNININVGVTPELKSLLAALIQPRTEMEAAVLPLETEAEPLGVALPAEAETAAPEEPKATAAATHKNEEPAPAPAQPVYDEAYVREVMEVVRRRIEGENYKNETSGERYKRYHKALTAEFKRIALQVSADTANPTDKPTTLPEDLRPVFAKKCSEIGVDENGELTTATPF